MSRQGLVPNIGTLQRRHRLILGLVAWAAAGAGLAALLVLDANRLWRLALFIPLWAGAIGFFQHREKT